MTEDESHTGWDPAEHLVACFERSAVAIHDDTREVVLGRMYTPEHEAWQEVHQSISTGFACKSAVQFYSVRQYIMGCTHTGLSAAACTLTSTSPFFSFEDTGVSFESLSTFAGSPLPVMRHVLCVAGISMYSLFAAATKELSSVREALAEDSSSCADGTAGLGSAPVVASKGVAARLGHISR